MSARDSDGSDSDDENRAQGLNVELHPVLQSGNIKLVKSLYLDQKNESIKKENNPYLNSKSTRGQKRKLIDLNESETKTSHVSSIPKTKKSTPYDSNKTTEMDPWDALFYTTDMSLRSKYLKDYSKMSIEEDSESEEDEEENADEDCENDTASVRFIHHPVLYKDGLVGKMEKPNLEPLLTVKERLKLRRQERKKKRMKMYQQISNGELQKPATKVSLNKINNVLMNDRTIEDPTKFEAMVKKEILERKKEHEKINEERKLEALAKKHKEKLEQQNESLSSLDGYFCKVFLIHNLSSPKIRFQINTTAKQLKLFGFSVRLRTDLNRGRGIIWIVSDKLTNLNKFERKIVKFNHHNVDDIKGFKIEKKWEGPAGLTKTNGMFATKKVWFMREFSSEDELMRELVKHGAAKYW